jgi:hypothetical protein
MLAKDPVHWAESVVGTRTRFAFACLNSVAFAVCAVAMAHIAARAAVLEHEWGELMAWHRTAMWVLFHLIVFVGSTVFPIMYLTVLKDVLARLTSVRKINPEPSLHPTPPNHQPESK